MSEVPGWWLDVSGSSLGVGYSRVEEFQLPDSMLEFSYSRLERGSTLEFPYSRFQVRGSCVEDGGSRLEGSTEVEGSLEVGWRYGSRLGVRVWRFHSEIWRFQVGFSSLEGGYSRLEVPGSQVPRTRLEFGGFKVDFGGPRLHDGGSMFQVGCRVGCFRLMFSGWRF